MTSTPDTFGEETESILSRTKALLPILSSDKTEILSAFAGLRPSREGGARVAREQVQVGATRQPGILVHNYGAGGTGFQAGYGMAVEAVDTVAQEIKALGIQSQSRL
jgi:D-amino-acid oxidase